MKVLLFGHILTIIVSLKPIHSTVLEAVWEETKLVNSILAKAAMDGDEHPKSLAPIVRAVHALTNWSLVESFEWARVHFPDLMSGAVMIKRVELLARADPDFSEFPKYTRIRVVRKLSAEGPCETNPEGYVSLIAAKQWVEVHTQELEAVE